MAYYTAGILVILAVFNLAVYGLFVRNISDHSEHDEDVRLEEKEKDDIETLIIQRAQSNLRGILLIVDGLIIILVGGLSYFLAGRALRPLELAYTRQRKFISDAAHELRTPLAVMKTGTEAVLASGGSQEDLKSLAEDYSEELNYLSAMVNDLLFLANRDEFRKTEFRVIDFARTMDKQIQSMRIYGQKKGITLKFETQEEKFLINGDEAQLKRLITNLIKNAIDYNGAGGEVSLSLDKKGGQILLKVLDSGVGIPEKDLPYVFDRFYKVDQSRSDRVSGSGLGLSIVYEIVKSHRGEIDIRSTVNKGTEVSITLPFSQ